MDGWEKGWESQYQMPVEEMDDTVCVAGLSFVVCHHDYGFPFIVEAMEKLHHLLAHLGVEVSGRFVGKDDGWVADDCAGDGHTLCLSAGKLSGKMGGAV